MASLYLLFIFILLKQNFYIKTVCFSRIQNLIVGLEGKNADYLTTTTTAQIKLDNYQQEYQYRLCQMMIVGMTTNRQSVIKRRRPAMSPFNQRCLIKYWHKFVVSSQSAHTASWLLSRLDYLPSLALPVWKRDNVRVTKFENDEQLINFYTILGQLSYQPVIFVTFELFF